MRLSEIQCKGRGMLLQKSYKTFKRRRRLKRAIEKGGSKKLDF